MTMQGVFQCPHAQRKTAGQRIAGSQKFKMAPVRPGEEELGRKWDRCVVDTTFKTGILKIYTSGKRVLMRPH